MRIAHLHVTGESRHVTGESRALRLRCLPALVLALLTACAGPPEVETSTASVESRPPAQPSPRALAARTATSMIGVPYRFGGTTPSGFDCSGLVVYSYAQVGHPGLPHSAASLERLTQPVSLHELEPGDLVFFQLDRKKTSHVGIYVGNRSFVHAPSRGKRVERVGFDHVYWGSRLSAAGRLEL